MHLPRRDVIATVFVAVAALVYLLWVIDAALPGLGSTRATGLVVLALGIAASMSAVVPHFDELIHGNKPYLVVTSLIGLVGMVGGLLMLLSASEAGLAIVAGAMGVLWLIATVHHTLLEQAAIAPPRVRGTPGRLAHG